MAVENNNGVKTGLYEFDCALNLANKNNPESGRGLQNGHLMLLAGRAAVGKTTLVLSFIDGAFRRQATSCLLFSPGLDEEQTMKRLRRIHGLGTGIADDQSHMADLNLFIDDTAGVSVTEMKEKYDQISARRAVDVIIIDYAQMISVSEGHADIDEKMTLVYLDLRQWAREINKPILLLCRTNEEYKRICEKPSPEDVPGYKNGQEFVDDLILMHRDDYDNASGTNSRMTEFKIYKPFWHIPSIAEQVFYCGRYMNITQ